MRELISLCRLKGISYKESIIIQEELQKSVINNQNYGYILLVEYSDHIFTQGKNGKNNNFLITDSDKNKLGIQYFNTDRGGDITYHGPGQIVCYPIFNMKKMNLGVKKYVFYLEQIIQQFLKSIDIQSERIHGRPGIWVNEKKIASIGVNIKKYVTKHGFSINIKNDLSFYNYINPCGYESLEVTSAEMESGVDYKIEELFKLLEDKIAKAFHININ